MADAKITALTALTGLAFEDVLPIVDDPAGTPITKKTTIEDIHKLPAGTTTQVPLKLQTGTLNTTPQEGGVEFNTKVPYLTHAASARGVLQTTQIASIQSDFTLSAASGVQSAFPAANNLITLEGSMTYLMRGLYIMNTGSTTHTTAMAFALAGGASVTSFEYITTLWSAAANTIATTQSTTHVSGVASKVLNATSTAVYTIIQFEGLIRMNAGGTVEPQINFSANPGGTNLMKVGSYIMFTPMGSNTMTAVGNWS